MKHRKFLKGLLATALAATMLLGQGNVAQAAAKENIKVKFEGEFTTKTVASEDVKVMQKAFGYTSVDNRDVVIADSNTKAYVDWKNSKISSKAVYETHILCPEFSRDKNGNLVVKKKNGEVYYSYHESIAWIAGGIYAGDEGCFFDIRSKSDPDRGSSLLDQNAINDRIGATKLSSYHYDANKLVADHKITDAYIVRLYYTMDGKGPLYASGGSEGRKTGYTDIWVLPKGVSTKLKFTASTSGTKKTMYAKQAVNVRSSASMSGKILGVLKFGQKVTVTGSKNGWYKITYNGKVGYVYKTYLSTKK